MIKRRKGQKKTYENTKEVKRIQNRTEKMMLENGKNDAKNDASKRSSFLSYLLLSGASENLALLGGKLNYYSGGWGKTCVNQLIWISYAPKKLLKHFK